MSINLTQHAATAEQTAAGVVDLGERDLARLQKLLTFGSPPDEQEIRARADAIAEIAALSSPFPRRAMIGGALWLMSPLAVSLWRLGIEPVFAFSVRETEEQKQLDGSIKKIAIFRHAGFIPAVYPDAGRQPAL